MKLRRRLIWNAWIVLLLSSTHCLAQDHYSAIDYCRLCSTELGREIWIASELQTDSIYGVLDGQCWLQLQQWIDERKLAVWEDPRGFTLISRLPIQTKLPTLLLESTTSSTPSGIENNPLEVRKHLNSEIIHVGHPKSGKYQQAVEVQGRIRSSVSDEPIFGATLWIDELQIGTSSDPDGYYKLTLPKGKYTLTVRSLQMDELVSTIIVHSNDRLDLLMHPSIRSLHEVVISSESKAHVERPIMGIERIAMKQVQTVPRIMGEPDVIKVATMLPGVQTVAEGTGGINVRGAPSDQNIFYLDQIPIYNANHFMGFFSAFPSYGLGDFTLYKGSLPSQYGGRLSSVVDVKTKEATSGLQGGISPISSDMQWEGVALNDRFSYLLAGRTTYSNWIMKSINVAALEGSSGHFQDGLCKIQYNDNGNLWKITSYASRDAIQLNGLTSFGYSNLGTSLSWSRQIKGRHWFAWSGAYAQYSYNEENERIEFKPYRYAYDLNHYETKALLKLNLGERHEFNFGVVGILYLLDQGSVTPLRTSSFAPSLDFGAEQGLESALFVEDVWRMGDRISLRLGARLNHFEHLGPATEFEYLSGQPRSVHTISDTLEYGPGERIAAFTQPDLRMALRYSLSELTSLKASLDRSHQYISMLTNTVTITPSARWKLADGHIQPMESWQAALGLFSRFRDAYEWSVEVYAKRVHHMMDFKDGADLIFGQYPEMMVLQGQLDAHGIEGMLKKTKGKLTGWLNYTYARSHMLVEGINEGKSYPSNFDCPHTINLSLSYQLSTRVTASGNFVYHSGRPVTYPKAVFYQQSYPITYYSSRNEFRIPSYIRFDLGMTVEGNLRSNKRFHGSWHFSIYNLLGRNNPFTVYAVQEAQRIAGYTLSIFGSPIPSVAYRIKLGSYAP
jgi:hypothetical protein